VGRPGAGAAIGGALGLGAGALIGDQLQGQEQKQQEQHVKLDQQRQEIERNRALIEELKRSNIEARETDRGITVNLPNVAFQFNSAELTPDGRDKVKQIATIVNRQASGRKISVEGHASRERADQEAYNQQLSEKRAKTVAEGLEVDGVNGDRINSKGFGTRSPVASNETEDGRRKNRRVEVIIEN
jgi:outer membrane protein OmpA-like peptidoglycan-associated protein